MKPVLKYSATEQQFGLFGAFEIRAHVRKAGFIWDTKGFWKTASPFKALQYAVFADAGAEKMLMPLKQAIASSKAVNHIANIPAPVGLEYMPFQKAGIMYAVHHPHCLIGDEPGLGKTIQALGVANYLRLKRLLVICPAGLRLNWAREIEKWHLYNPGLEVMLTGQHHYTNFAPRSVVTSYDLAKKLEPEPGAFDLVIIDEGHYVKNPQADRTKKVLGVKGKPGLIDSAPRKIVLTGTPIPNRVNEIFPVIRKLAPQVIDGMGLTAFLNYYAVSIWSDYGPQIVGIRHEEELYTRLRSGLMVRRLKKDVLQDLPDKRYKMVVFPKNGAFVKVLRREEQFSAAEILKHGVPVGSALPEIRREMGIEKAPLAVQYVADLLEEGVQKVLVFAHHRDVVTILQRGLAEYCPVVVTGQSSPADRQFAVDTFQTVPRCRIFIGNILAAGTGITLTATQDVVFVEGSWVPGENEQAEDRAHRIGQKNGVLVHYLVVEGSLDAVILGAAARKRDAISKLLDGGI